MFLVAQGAKKHDPPSPRRLWEYRDRVVLSHVVALFVIVFRPRPTVLHHPRVLWGSGVHTNLITSVIFGDPVDGWREIPMYRTDSKILM